MSQQFKLHEYGTHRRRMMFSIGNLAARRGVKTTASERRNQRHLRRRGAMLVVVAVMLVGFIATVVFSVEIAHRHLSRTELRSATDAAAQAASQKLSATSDTLLAIQAGQEIALLNQVNGQPLHLAADDFEFGRSRRDDTGRVFFSVGATPPNAVRVNLDR